MDRTLPGVHFIDTLEEGKHRISENGITTVASAAPSVITTPMAPSALPSSVSQPTLISNPTVSVLTRHPEVSEIQQVIRQPLSNIVPDMPVNRRIKTEDISSAECAGTSAAGQSLIDFLDKFDNYKPTIPESIVQHYMQTAGLSNADPRVTQLIALASQKFISDVVNDAFHFSQTQKCKKSSDKKPTLTLDVLKPVLAEYGITVKKPAYMQ